MFIFVSVLIFLVSVLLILIVLVQNSKGGGLAANFQSQNQYMGARKTTDFLEKGTWVLAGVLLFLCIAAAATINRESGEGQNSIMQQQIEEVADPSRPTFPEQAPATEE